MSSDPPQAPSFAQVLRRLIRSLGPVSIQHYMGESNARYYATRDPLGAGGDFTTAPEISQMFGELVGLWLTDIWARAGRPADAAYVELGPGRGTLARDALRVMRGQGLAAQAHLVEGSGALGAIQREVVPGATWHADLADVPDDRPLLVVANEFLDALPIRQLVRAEAGWRERMVALSGEEFVTVAGDKPMDAAVPDTLQDAPVGTLVETCPGAAATMREVAARLVRQGGAALFIDYGHDASRTGSTLQALRAHEKVGVFAHPGEADLTAHVDFAEMARVAVEEGARWLGTREQGRWLVALGIAQRARALSSAAPDRADMIASALDRLVAPEQMGELFKVMGLAAPKWPDGAGFD